MCGESYPWIHEQEFKILRSNCVKELQEQLKEYNVENGFGGLKRDIVPRGLDAGAPPQDTKHFWNVQGTPCLERTQLFCTTSQLYTFPKYS
ncbi:hypothetical protein AGMMS49949_04770 [Alphaproteobacteria bacterium]|nr:hypothetical protein AGMMS49949_04770 [Alphaproteobacteria bacterium]GHS97241.1 hypothetical protein AGMMS50296_4070 [Alphaproteobacteria bacterium]